MAWALQERDAKGADSSTKEGHLIPTRRGGFFNEAVADPLSTHEQRTYSNGGNNAGKPHNLIAEVTPILEAGARTGKSTDDPRAGIGIGQPGDPMFTLQSGKQHAVAFKASHFTRGKDGAPNEIAPPLSADADKGDQDTLVMPAVAFQTRIARNGRGQPEEICPALNGSDAGATSDMRPVIAGSDYGVRRLTPLECLRLMSWPDNWMDGLGFADSTKYRMCGNGVVSNVAEWIGRRIVKAFSR